MNLFLILDGPWSIEGRKVGGGSFTFCLILTQTFSFGFGFPNIVVDKQGFANVIGLVPVVILLQEMTNFY